MRWFGHPEAVILSVALTAAPVIARNSAPQTADATQIDAAVHAPSDFAGVWIYNADESINIATGKPEQAPRSATQRAAARRAPSSSAPSSTSAASGARSTDDRSGRASDLGPSPEMLHAARDLMRDLLEIPESLTIAVSATGVTFVDDLKRERTYPTDGSKHHFRLGGSEFDARAVWRQSQLHKDIDGDFGFKMTEVYFLSADGKRLFVILRVPGLLRNDAPTGANRVYDKAPSSGP